MGGGSGLYEYGDELVLTAVPERCYSFVGWYTKEAASRALAKGQRQESALDGFTLLSTEPTYSCTVNSSLKLYPVFHRLGDVNGDELFNGADIDLLTKYINGASVGNFLKDEADTNSDGDINIVDVVEIINSITKQ